MMTSEHWSHRLSEYMDDELSASEREALELHLLACPPCAELLVELRQVVAEAAALEDREPERDLWPGIAGRLTPRGAGAGSPDRDGVSAAVPPRGEAEALSLEARRREVGRRSVALTVPQLLAAGIALVVLSASGVWLATAPARAGADGIGVAAGGPGGAGTPGGAVEVTFTTAYETAIRDLETEFREQRERLDPETIRVVERNLAIIDAAIGEARQALAEDPASGFLNEHLADAMRRKVDLLRQATRIERTEI